MPDWHRIGTRLADWHWIDRLAPDWPIGTGLAIPGHLRGPFVPITQEQALYTGWFLVFSEDEFKANFQVPPKTQICKSLQFVSNLSQSWPIRCQTSAKQSSTNPMHSHSYANLVQIHRKNLLLVDCQSTAIHSDLPSINVNPAKLDPNRRPI